MKWTFPVRDVPALGVIKCGLFEVIVTIKSGDRWINYFDISSKNFVIAPDTFRDFLFAAVFEWNVTRVGCGDDS